MRRSELSEARGAEDAARTALSLAEAEVPTGVRKQGEGCASPAGSIGSCSWEILQAPCSLDSPRARSCRSPRVDQARRVLSVYDCAVAQMQIRQAENERLLRQYAAARNEVQTLREQFGRRTPSPRGSRSVREPFRSLSFRLTTQTAAARDAQECARQ